MKKQIKAILKKLHLEITGQERMVVDINLDCTRPQKRILLCYLDYQRTARELRQNFGHTNRQEMMQMIKVCIEMGWCIDVCGCNDESARESIPADYYDYILGFGQNFRYALKKNPKAKTVIYMTENPYFISYERESERVAYFKERTGRSFGLERTGIYYQKEDEKAADAVLCLGEKSYFPEEKQVVRIWPSALKNPTFSLDFRHKKKTSFLVYGTDGFVHKGNDILIEVFARHPEWELFLCGARGEEKAKEAGYLLPPNVHAEGFVDTLSEQFKRLAGQCYYLLLPSCSEAPSTSVLTGMRHGMLPIVSRGIGLDDLWEYCSYFEDFHVEAVEQTLLEAIEEEEAVLWQKSEKAMRYADEAFTLEQYTQSLRKALEALLC
ncbi:MAG: hypothetical protein PUB98_07305 [Clostridiales bacterium]|nr:hypothetical protein [Clostridiales bacterium]